MAGADSRQWCRTETSAQANLRRSGALSYRIEVYDLSERGCKVEFVERPNVGETVWVKFDGVEPLVSRVRWTAGFVAGLEFGRPIDSRVLQHLLARLR